MRGSGLHYVISHLSFTKPPFWIRHLAFFEFQKITFMGLKLRKIDKVELKKTGK